VTLAGRKILVTAGPTREYLDPVRYFSNDSSGRMGFALAAEAVLRGAAVTLVTGPVNLKAPHCRVAHVVTARQMHRAAFRYGKGADIIIASAAVGDWRPVRRASLKIKKPVRASSSWEIPFVLNPDILKDFSRLKTRGRPVLVGFALETNDLIRNARAKLKAKKLDLIVANSPEAFGNRISKVIFLDADGNISRYGRADKKLIAKRILDIVEKKLSKLRGHHSHGSVIR
jgi:phosphopantothenoylcysteine decarboxylase/phosphopantothenate--cysteine ligase